MAAYRSLLIVFCILLPNHLYAFSGYECTVSDAYQLAANGKFTTEGLVKNYIGRSFTVDKASGRMLGRAISNVNAFGKPVVIDEGSSKNAYKVITIYRPKVTVSYLYIQVFNESPPYPFMFIDGNKTLSGTCSEF